MSTRRLNYVLAILLTILAATWCSSQSLSAGDSWPEWRGDGQGHGNATGLPVRWTADQATWQTRIPGLGWSTPVVRDVDGHDPDAVAAAVTDARGDAARPSLICAKTVIGYGSPGKQGKASSHGAPLGDDEIALVRESFLLIYDN